MGFTRTLTPATEPLGTELPGSGPATEPAGRRSRLISVVVPIYDEELLVPLLHQQITEVMDGLGLPWEVVYVDDGSRDRSLGLLLTRQQQDPRVVVVERPYAVQRPYIVERPVYYSEPAPAYNQGIGAMIGAAIGSIYDSQQ